LKYQSSVSKKIIALIFHKQKPEVCFCKEIPFKNHWISANSCRYIPQKLAEAINSVKLKNYSVA